jgi:succinate dehydrogenase / fumarate reductase, cytochrome b subunit
MSTNFRSALTGYTSYRGREGFIAFLLHRITGLGTLLFLTFHIATTATVYFSPQWYDRLIMVFRWPLIMFLEIILVFCVIYHGVNGIRLAYSDLIKPELYRSKSWKTSFKSTILLTILLWLPLATIMGYNLLKYGLGLFEGN